MKNLFSIPNFCFIIVLSFISCKNTDTGKEASYAEIKSVSDSITTLTQQVLIKNLTKAVNEKGFEYAVEFCNEKADTLTKSTIANTNITTIQRISDRNRNPNNDLKTQNDKNIFEYFKNHNLKDSLLIENDSYVYYKRIDLAMPACVKCHGNKDNIDINALAIINKLYPEDKAKNYNLNDFRGLWKVTYDKNKTTL